MKEQDKMLIIETRLNKIESLLSQTRLLLAILIAVCLIGFYGLSNLMGVIGDPGRIFFIMVAAGGVCYLILLFIEKTTGAKKELSLKEEDLQRMLRKIESEKNDKSS